jgi:hypothetical protein
VSAAPNAICPSRCLHIKVCEGRRRRTIRTTSSHPAPANAGTSHALNGSCFRSASKFDAEEEAVIVTVEVLFVSSAPSAQVTPASELETLQEKVTLLPESPLIGVKVSVDVALLPGVIVNVPGEALSEKSPGTVVKLKTLDQAPYTPLEEDKALTCQ